YPFSVDADQTHPDASVATGQTIGAGSPTTATANSGKAHADPNLASADAIISNYDAAGTGQSAAASLAFRRQAAAILAGPAAVGNTNADSAAADSSTVHVGSAEVHTRHAFDKTDVAKLTVTSTSILHGVGLVGGTI